MDRVGQERREWSALANIESCARMLKIQLARSLRSETRNAKHWGAPGVGDYAAYDFEVLTLLVARMKRLVDHANLYCGNPARKSWLSSLLQKHKSLFDAAKKFRDEAEHFTDNLRPLGYTPDKKKITVALVPAAFSHINNEVIHVPNFIGGTKSLLHDIAPTTLREELESRSNQLNSSKARQSK